MAKCWFRGIGDGEANNSRDGKGWQMSSKRWREQPSETLVAIIYLLDQMTAVNFFHHREMCDSQPVFEAPPEKYSTERIIHVLLDPNI